MIMVQAGLGIKSDHILMAQVVKCLPSKHEAPSSNSSTTNKSGGTYIDYILANKEYEATLFRGMTWKQARPK
jgi:hypothetical protein